MKASPLSVPSLSLAYLLLFFSDAPFSCFGVLIVVSWMCSMVSHFCVFAHTVSSAWNVLPLLKFLKKSLNLPSRLCSFAPISSTPNHRFYYFPLFCVSCLYDCSLHTEVAVIYLHVSLSMSLWIPFRAQIRRVFHIHVPGWSRYLINICSVTREWIILCEWGARTQHSLARIFKQLGSLLPLLIFLLSIISCRFNNTTFFNLPPKDFSPLSSLLCSAFLAFLYFLSIIYKV